MISVRIKKVKQKVDAIDYYADMLERVEEDIERVKRKEFRIMGTAFITLTDELPWK